jgi:hypothetical protein
MVTYFETESNMNFDNMIDQVNDLVEDYIQNNMVEVSADKLGLDIRAGYRLLVDTDADIIGVHVSNVRMLEYYGGFEYVDSTCRETIGDYVFFTGGSDRVQDCLEFYNEELEGVV